ncbi:MAG: carbonic anhydrase [Acidimicrobiales bacterium]|nr:carbonic anhydrase [Acidimicrobiales bacterium]
MSHPADIALNLLRAGNKRFAEGRQRPHFTPAQRQQFVEGQQPWAVVLGCSDSRVPIETLFDVGPGELFVVRSAGHVISDAGYASVRYAVEQLGSRLVVVMGHEDCGAVAASRDGDAPAYLAPVTDHIHTDAPTLAEAVDQHVRESTTEMREWFDRAGFTEAEVAVIGASYELASGEVHWLD